MTHVDGTLPELQLRCEVEVVRSFQHVDSCTMQRKLDSCTQPHRARSHDYHTFAATCWVQIGLPGDEQVSE